MPKCIAHHQKAIARREDRPDTLEKDYLGQWKLLFTMVGVLWRYRVAHWASAEFAERQRHLEAWLDRLLATSGRSRATWRSKSGSASVGT